MKIPILAAAAFFAFNQIAVLAQNIVPGAVAQTQLKPATLGLAADYGKLPLSFEANQGQIDPQVRFLSRGQGYSLFLTDSAAELTLTRQVASGTAKRPASIAKRSEVKAAKTDVVRMELAGANHSLRVEGADQLPGKANYFIGKDPAKWHSNIPTYAKVRYSDVYPGVDLVYYGDRRQLEYDFILAPGADPKPVRLRFAGAEQLKLDGDGDLTISAKNGEIAFHKPVVYQMKNGQRQSVEGHFALIAKDTVGFTLGSYDHSRELVIDPTLAYSTYLGSSFGAANTIAVNAAGEAFVAGVGSIEKLNSTGSAVEYLTYLGGTTGPAPAEGVVAGIAVDSSGNAYLTGHTEATDFPVTSGAFQAASKCPNQYFCWTGFVTKLDPTGSALVYSTYLGGSGYDGEYSYIGLSEGDTATAIAIDESGDAYIGGYTASHDFPITSHAFQQTNKVPGDSNTGFVTKLNPTGTALIYSTYLGGTGFSINTPEGSPETYTYGDAVMALAVDGSGSVYIAGQTASHNFPITKGAFQTVNKTGTFDDNYSSFVAKLNPAGTDLAYSTYLGGSGQTIPGYNLNGDTASGIAIDGSGYAYVTGEVNSSDFPTTSGAYQKTNKASPTYFLGYNTFVTKVAVDGKSLVYSTYLGGSITDVAAGIAVDSQGQAFVTGMASSSNYPTTAGAFQAAAKGGSNAFLTQLNSTGSGLLYSTYVGGSANDTASSIALDGFGNPYIAGSTNSANFPVTAGAAEPSPSGGFATKFYFSGITGTTTTLVSDANPQSLGLPVTFTAYTAPVEGSGIPTGVVSFILDGALTANVVLDGTGHAVYSTCCLSAGQHRVVASYLGDSTAYSISSGSLTQTFTAPAHSSISFPGGFAQASSSFQLNGSAGISSSALELTNGGQNEAGSVFLITPVNIQSFTTDFTFLQSNANGDGMTFTIQNTGPTALGGIGGSLGSTRIGKSVSIKFDLFNNAGEGANSTGIFLNGVQPTVPAINLTGTGIDLHSGTSGNQMKVHITYDGSYLNLTIDDSSGKGWSHSFPIDIPATVGGSTAYIGFTGSTGSATSTQDILSWTYQAGYAAPPVPNYIRGFSADGLVLNGTTGVSSDVSLISPPILSLTSDGYNQAGSAFYAIPVNIQSFTTKFSFQILNPNADGFTFTIQNAGPGALGGKGGSLGYTNIRPSVAIKFDLFDDLGEGTNSTGLFLNGAEPAVPAIDLTGTGIDLHSGDPVYAQLTYDGTDLKMTLTDQKTVASWSHSWPVNIPATVGGPAAYVGFTGATGGARSTQTIKSWTYVVGPPAP